MKANAQVYGKNYQYVTSKKAKSRKAYKNSVNRSKRMLMLLIAIVTIMIGISFNSMTAKADNAAHANEVKMYQNYCVQPGDNLWTIAEHFVDLDHYKSTKEFAKEIQNINEIADVYKLTNGTYLMIPYYDEAK